MAAQYTFASPRQIDLFDAPPELPAGFRYRPNLIDASGEAQLVRRLADLPFEPFDFHGRLARRYVAGFGLRYDYASRRLQAAAAIPDWLIPLREAVGEFAGQPASAFVQVLVNRYPSGAGIGWHKDKMHFEEVVAVSLLAPRMLRLRRRRASAWERRNLMIDPRSAYLLTGPSRHLWEHSIAPGADLRYSITFRTLAGRAEATVAGASELSDSRPSRRSVSIRRR
jgi:alkylated DNA repair dioxygenase AlkB